MVTRLPEVKFALRLTSAGVYPFRRWMFYQLQVDGQGIQNNVNLANPVGVNVPIDAAELLKPFVSIPYPGLSSNTEQSILSSTAEVQLVYGEFEYNVDTQQTTVVSSSSSSTIKVIDAASQFVDYQFDPNTPSQVLMSRKPQRISMSNDAHDWFYVLVSDNQAAIVSVRLYDKAGTQIGSQSVVLSPGYAGYVPVGGANMLSSVAGSSSPATWGYATVSITGIVGWQTTEYRISYDRDPCEKEVAEVHFKEPVGGWSGMDFDSIRKNRVRTSTVSEGRYQWGETPADNLSLDSGGRRIASLQAAEEVTLTREFDRREAYDYRDYLGSMVSSERVGVKMVLPNGEQAFVPGIITNDNLDTYVPDSKFEFSITIRLFKDFISA